MESADSSRREHPSLMIMGVSLVLLLTIGVVSLFQTGVAPTGRSTTTSVGSTCSTPIRSNATGAIEVYDLAPGSAGLICVSYAFQGAGNYSFSPVGFGPWFPNGSSYADCSIGNLTVIAYCSAISITPSISEFIHPAAQNVTVAYTIQANLNAKGLFLFFIGTCFPIILAFGPVPSSVSLPTFLCISSLAFPISSSVTGVSNFNVVVVPAG